MARIQISESRFAALMDDGKKSEKKNKQSKQNQQVKQDPKQSNMKTKKKKGKEVQNNTSSASRQPHSSYHGDGSNKNTDNPEQWDQWVSKDAAFTDDIYEKDLQEALLLSKLEIEEQKQVKKLVKCPDDGKPEETSQNKKKKKKVMSLEQFNTTDHDKKEIEKTKSPEPVTPSAKIHPDKAIDKYFIKVEDDVTKILRKEKIQAEYKKHYVQESVMASKYQEELEKKDVEVKLLHQQYHTLEEEHKKVKKRNKQLCFILAEGEMKDKTEVLLQVEELCQIKDELTDQVSELTAELEKERSRVHTLKSEIDKLKGTKGDR